MTLSAAAKEAKNAYMRKYRQERMTEEQKERQRQYQAQWRAENQDRVKQHQKDFWERQAAEMKVGQ